MFDGVWPLGIVLTCTKCTLEHNPQITSSFYPQSSVLEFRNFIPDINIGFFNGE